MDNNIVVENVFKNKNFVLTFLGGMVSNIGNIFYNFAVSFWLLELTNNNAIIQASYLAFTGITYLLFSFPGGVISDRFNKAKVMYICDYLKAILLAISTLSIILINTTTYSIVILFVAGFFGNIIGAIFGPTSSSILPLILKEEQLQQANSYNSALQSFQGILGMILAGILYALIPVTTQLFIVSVCYLLSGISEMFIKYNHIKNDKPLTIKSSIEDIKEGFIEIKKQKIIFALICVIIFVNFFFSPLVDNFVPYFIKTDVATNDYLFKDIFNPEMWSSIFEVFFSVASIITALVISTKPTPKKIGKRSAIIVLFLSLTTIIMSVCYYIFVYKKVNLNAFLIIMCVNMAIIGILCMAINIPSSTAIQMKTDKEQLGRVSSLMNIGCQGLIPISLFIAGFVINYLGVISLMIFCSIGLLITAIITFFNKTIQTE